MNARNLFPQDNRSAELVSAAGLIFVTACILAEPKLFHNLVAVEPLSFWLMTCTVLGSLQMLSLVMYPKTEVLRTVMSWVNGLFWVWLSLSTDGQDAAGIVLGLANLYAFVINVNLLRDSWKL